MGCHCLLRYMCICASKNIYIHIQAICRLLCVQTFAQSHIYIHAHTMHTPTHTYTPMHTHAHAHMHVHTHLHTCTHTHAHLHTHIRMLTHLHARTICRLLCVPIGTQFTHACTHTHARTHICTLTHLHACTHVCTLTHMHTHVLRHGGTTSAHSWCRFTAPPLLFASLPPLPPDSEEFMFSAKLNLYLEKWNNYPNSSRSDALFCTLEIVCIFVSVREIMI